MSTLWRPYQEATHLQIFPLSRRARHSIHFDTGGGCIFCELGYPTFEVRPHRRLPDPSISRALLGLRADTAPCQYPWCRPCNPFQLRDAIDRFLGDLTPRS